MQIVFWNIVAIYRRELQGYFYTPWAYAIAAVFWLICGVLFSSVLAAILTEQQQPLDMTIDFGYRLTQAFLSVLSSVSLFVLPILSMGLYTEECKQGTLELLATSPLTNWAVAIGKLWAVGTFFLTLLLPLLGYHIYALSSADPPMPLDLVFLGYLGLFLLALSILSIGMFISSLSDSTIVAAIATFGLVLLLFLVDAIGETLGGPWGAVLTHFSLQKHFTNWVAGELDTNSLAVFATYIGLGIFLTAQSIEAFRLERSA